MRRNKRGKIDAIDNEVNEMSTPNNSTVKLTQSCKTVATSTPIKEISEPMDFDISNADDFSTYESLTQSSNQISLSDSDSELTQNQSRRIPNVGQDWDYFKPMQTSSLYYVILNTSYSINDMAHRWLRFWEADSRKAMINMLQFFLDVAGYQHYEIREIYGKSEYNEKLLLEVFKEKCSLVLQNYTYLLRTNSEWSRGFKTSIYQFLHDVVLLSDEITTNKYSPLKEMFQFLKFMAHSEVRAVKHTAVVFVIKFLLVLSKLHRKYNDEITKYMKNKMVDLDIVQYKKKAVILMTFMKDLFLNVAENCWYHDEEMEEMRQECLKGLYKMLNYTFEFYTKMLDIFKQCLNNPSNKTRLATVEIIAKILKNSSFYPHLRGKSADIFRIVIDHRYDVDSKIVAESINIFTVSIKLYQPEIPHDILQYLYAMVYDKFYPRGSACGKFLYSIISNMHEGEIARIKKIVEFSNFLRIKHSVPLLVESLIDCAPELHSYGVIVDLLLFGQQQTEDKIKLMEILCHSVIQTVTGKSTIYREHYREGDIDYEQVEIIFKIVLPKFEDLFKKYSKKADCVKSLLQMLLAFPYNDQFTDKYKSSILEALKCLSKYFFETKESEELDMISELFSKTCSIYCSLKMHSTNILETICKRSIGCYKEIVENKDSWNQEDIEAILLQLQSLFKYHKLSLSWNIKVMQNIFPEITHLNERLLSYNVSCSCEYEKSVFRSSFTKILSNGKQQKENFKNLREKCDEFLEACYGYLQDGTSKIITDTVFLCLCDFYIEMADQMYRNEDKHPHVMALKKKLPPDHKYLLVTYLKEHVFNGAVSESSGLQRFFKFSQCIMKRGLPLSILPNVFIYYNKFYNIYGDLFDQILKNISLIDANTVGIIVSSTLIGEFEEARNKEDLNDNNQQYIELKKLALLFVRSLSPQLQVVSLRFAINFAFEKEENLVFLQCLEDFCNEISRRSKSFISNYMEKQENYNKFQKNKYVLQFVKFLTLTKRRRVEIVQAGSKRTRKALVMSTSSESFADSDTISGSEAAGPARRRKKKTRSISTSYASLTTDGEESSDFE